MGTNSWEGALTLFFAGFAVGAVFIATAVALNIGYSCH